jgi:hypothetical protein
MAKPQHPEKEFEDFLAHCEQPLIRELAWAIGSPPLLKSAANGDVELLDMDFFSREWELGKSLLQAWDQTPSAASLEEMMGFDSHRLGKRFERLVGFWFLNQPHWELIQENWVISDESRTIGEFDLLVRNLDTKEVWHIELACKFYLNAHQTSRWGDWKGTNTHDDLQHKMDKIMRQLSLSQHPAGKLALSLENIQIDRRVAWLKGWFFHHIHEITQHQPPRNAHPKYPAGWWCRQHEWTEWMAQNAGLWIILQPHEWLHLIHELSATPVAPEGIAEIWRQEGLFRGQLVAHVIKKENHWVEISRGFVVPDTWPN